MAADQRLERVTIARLRRRDQKPITDLDYHRVLRVHPSPFRRFRFRRFRAPNRAPTSGLRA